MRVWVRSQIGDVYLHETKEDGVRIQLNGQVWFRYGEEGKPHTYWGKPWDTIRNPETSVQLYTGCKDKNGSEIWEGDIVLYKGKMRGFVEMFSGMFLISFSDQIDSGPIGFLQTADMEVVGNIFKDKV